MLGTNQEIQDKAQSAGNGLFLFKGCNAVPDFLVGSLRASRETLTHGVAPLGEDWPFPARRALWLNVSRPAEHGNFTLMEYQDV